MSESEPSSGFDPVEELADAFLARYRRGERPNLSEYTDQHPELAERIRALFPALLVMEELGSPSGQAAGPRDGAAGPSAGMPRRMGDYLLLRTIGSGGMGVVYEAIQESLGRHVALKMLPSSHLADPTRLERFRREARAAARLHHTHIVPVFGVGEHDGLHYYTMQYIRGHGLDAVLQEVKRLRSASSPPASVDPTVEQHSSTGLAHALCTGQFAAAGADQNGSTAAERSRPPGHPRAARPASRPDPAAPAPPSEISSQPEAQYVRSVARIGAQVAEALEYAHQQGILHRDINPSNLLLDAHGDIWVTDFGLAKAQDSDELTRTGDIVGTLRFMAPERFSGWSDPRSDVYALGATLYELLTLRPAFDESDRVKLIERVLHESPTALRQIDRRIPRDLETIVQKALAREPGQRYTTAGQMGEDLRRFVAGRPILARRSSSIERLWRWSLRNKLLAGAIATVAVALVAVAGLSVLYADRQRHFAIEQGKANRQVTDMAANLERSLAESKRLLAMRNFDRGQAAFEKGEIGPGMLWMIESWRAAVDAGDPAWQQAARANLAAWRPYHGRLKAVFSHTSPVVACAHSPDSRKVISGSEDGTAQLWDAATGKSLGSPLKHAKTVIAVAFSPDGKTVLTGSYDNTARLWDATDGEPLCPPLAHQGAVAAVAFHPGGKIVVTGAGDRTTRLWDAATGQPIGAPRKHPAAVASVAFSPDGRTMICGCAGGTARLWEFPGGRGTRGALEPAGVVSLSGDGNLVLTRAGATRRWEPSSAKPLGQFVVSQRNTLAATLSPDAKIIFKASLDGTMRLWDPATREPFGVPMQHQSELRGVAFSPDGKTILTGSRDKEARLWDAATGTPLGFVEHQGPVVAVAFSPDGKAILTASEDGTMRLWEATVGLPVGQSVEVPSTESLVDLSRDLKVLVSWGRGLRGTYARLWDGATRQTTGPVLALPGDLHIAGLSPDGKMLLTTFSDRMAQVWDATRGNPLAPPQEQPGPIECVAFSPDSKAVLFGGKDGTAWIWDIYPSRIRGAIPVQRGSVDAVGWSPDVRSFVTGLEVAEVQVWDAATFTALGKPMPHPGAVGRLSFSPDGKSILVGGEDGTARLWDAATRKPLLPPLVHHGGWVHALAFTPDGKLIATGGNDKLVRLWDAGTGQPIGPALRHDDGLRYVAFLADGRTMLTKTHSGEYRQFSAPPQVPADLDRVSAWVEVVTGLSLDKEQGLIHVLDNPTWLARRDELMRLGGPPETGPEQRLDPILFGSDPAARARTFMARKRWDDAEVAFDEAARARPFNASIWLERGRLHSVSAQPAKAAAALAQAAQFFPESLGIRYRSILSLLDLGDHAGVRRACSELLDRFGSSTDAGAANNVAWYCVLGPDAVADSAAPVRLAKFAVDQAPAPVNLNTLGAALYRARRFEEAIGRLEEGIRKGGGESLPQDWAFLAMAHHRLGHRVEARRWLDRFRTYRPDERRGAYWNELEIRLLRREAEALLKADSIFPSDPFVEGRSSK
jgi:WD40 repeat protein/serine/threonine protein kinase/tetratricopeptide (TPR) repeat protein